MYSQDQSAFLAAAKKADRSSGIYNSLADICMNLEIDILILFGK
jgi:hypothetical protein